MSKRAGFRFIPLFVGLLALLPVPAEAAPPPGIPDGWSDGFAYVNGARIHYYHAVPAPGKPVIIMCHGASDNGLCWTTLTWKLQDQYDIYMLDARSHGLSDPSLPGDAPDATVKDVVEFAQQMKLEKPILLGHSMGAGTVMRIGADYPDFAKAIVMLDPGLGAPGGRGGAGGRGPTSGPARGARAGSAPAAPDRLQIVMGGSPEALVAQNNYSFEDLVATGRRQNPKWDIVDIQYWALSKKQYHGRYAANPTSPATRPTSGPAGSGGTLAKITAPALILKADAPPETRKANEEAAKVMQRGKLVHIDGAAHNLHHDELERTVAELKTFFATLN